MGARRFCRRHHLFFTLDLQSKQGTAYQGTPALICLEDMGYDIFTLAAKMCSVMSAAAHGNDTSLLQTPSSTKDAFSPLPANFLHTSRSSPPFFFSGFIIIILFPFFFSRLRSWNNKQS